MLVTRGFFHLGNPKFMNENLTEEEMRKALFGGGEASDRARPVAEPDIQLDVVFVPPAESSTKKKPRNAFTPRLRVVLEVGNEFEGATQEFVYEADKLSTLLAEQEAVKSARKKYRYVTVISVKLM